MKSGFPQEHRSPPHREWGQLWLKGMMTRQGKRCNKSFPFLFDKYLEGIIACLHQVRDNNIQSDMKCRNFVWLKQMTQEGRLVEVY